jgi:hypothetical protein
MSSADFEEALGRAETLLAEVDRARDLARLIRAGQVGVVALVAFALAISVGTAGVSAVSALITSAVCAGVLVLLIGWAEVALVFPARRRISRDERAMIEIVSLLRELQVSVGADESWSGPRQRLVKARIARFPIGARGLR